MAKAIASATFSVAANSRSSDIFQGTSLQFNGNAFMKYLGAFNGAAAGLTLTLIVGSDSVYDDIPLGAQNRFPESDKDFIYTTGVEPGDQVQGFLRNTTAGALVCQFMVQREPA